MDVKELAYEITEEEVKPLIEELKKVYWRELFEKQVYLKQGRELSGGIQGTLNQLIEDEESHAFALKTILNNSGIKVEETLGTNVLPEPTTSLKEALSFDIKEEKISAETYNDAISKAGPKLKQLLEHIMKEEFRHIGILQKFLEDEAQ